MATDNDYIDYLKELLQPLGNITVKRMFGGHGVFKEGLMFGLVDNETFYLKVDDDSRTNFEKRNLPPFIYYKKGKPVSLAYYQAPDEALEDADFMCRWAEISYQVALRSKRK